MSVSVLVPANPLIGTWVHAEEFGSSVEYRITVGTTGLVVTAVDTSDGEVTIIAQGETRGSALSFEEAWASSGRINSCELRPGAAGQAV